MYQVRAGLELAVSPPSLPYPTIPCKGAQRARRKAAQSPPAMLFAETILPSSRIYSLTHVRGKAQGNARFTLADRGYQLEAVGVMGQPMLLTH